MLFENFERLIYIDKVTIFVFFGINLVIGNCFCNQMFDKKLTKFFLKLFALFLVAEYFLFNFKSEFFLTLYSIVINLLETHILTSLHIFTHRDGTFTELALEELRVSILKNNALLKKVKHRGQINVFLKNVFPAAVRRSSKETSYKV